MSVKIDVQFDGANDNLELFYLDKTNKKLIEINGKTIEIQKINIP